MRYPPPDTNVGLGMVPGYDTPEEKEIERLRTKLADAERKLAKIVEFVKTDFNEYEQDIGERILAIARGEK